MDRETKIIDYLYGELSASERQSFEEEMAANPALRAEIEAFEGTQAKLQSVKEDLSPEIPVIPFGSKSRLHFAWSWMTGIAASLLLIFTLFHTEVTYESGKLSLSFGNGKPTGASNPIVIDTSMVMNIAQSMFQEYRLKMDQSIHALDSSWHQNLLANNELMKKSWQQQITHLDQNNQQKLASLKKQFKEEQIPEMAHLFQQIQLEQRQDLEQMMNGMWNEWQTMRYNDLESISDAFNTIYDDVAQSQTETQALVSGILNNRKY